MATELAGAPEIATGFGSGDPRLRSHVDRLRRRAIDVGDARLAQVGERFLRMG